MSALKSKTKFYANNNIKVHDEENFFSRCSYFSPCCYFSASNLKKSFYSLETGSTTNHKNVRLDNSNILLPRLALKNKSELLNIQKKIENRNIKIPESDLSIHLFNESPIFLKMDGKNYSDLQDSLVNEISKSSIIEIEENCILGNLSKRKNEEEKNSSKEKKELFPTSDLHGIELTGDNIKIFNECDFYYLQLITEKYFIILEGVKTDQNISKTCKDWWKLSTNKGFIELYVN